LRPPDPEIQWAAIPHVILVNNELLRLEKLLYEQSRSSSAQGLNPRSAYSLLLALFVVSRILYYLLGVRFDARPILSFFQFIDPELLKHRLLESMYYLHVQPPGFNLYTGIVLKLFPDAYPTVFHVIHLALGIGICWFTYYLMTACGVRPSLALTLTGLFIVSPGVVLFENFMLYEYLLVFLLLAAAVVLYNFCLREKAIYAVLFFTCLLFLLLLRNHFHLIYIVGAYLLLLYFYKRRRNMLFLSGLIPLLLAFGLFLKNGVVFGAFSSSTWLGMNMDVILSHQLTADEAKRFVTRGLISPVSLIDAGAPIALYRPYVQMPPKTGIPVLDEEVTSTGATNFNNPVFLKIQRYYIKDGLWILRNYPVAYLRSLEAAWFSYFLPTGDFPFFDLNRPRIFKIDRFFNLVLFGQFRDASDRKELRAIAGQGGKLGLILYTGTFLLVGLPALWLWSVYYLVNGVRRKTIPPPIAVVIGFFLFNITYLTGVSNFLSSFENNRYRFQVDAFFVILSGIALEQLRRRFSRTAKEPT
jgi:hypothetical protein